MGPINLDINKSFKSLSGIQTTARSKGRQMTQTTDVCYATDFYSTVINFFSHHENDSNLRAKLLQNLNRFHVSKEMN